MTETENYLFEKIELIDKTIDDLRKQKEMLFDQLTYKRYKEIVKEKFEESLNNFVKENPYFSNYDYWYNNKLGCYCLSFNFDEDNTSDELYDVIINFRDKHDYDWLLYTTNHRLF